MIALTVKMLKSSVVVANCLSEHNYILAYIWPNHLQIRVEL